jgi:hypothetical protein
VRVPYAHVCRAEPSRRSSCGDHLPVPAGGGALPWLFFPPKGRCHWWTNVNGPTVANKPNKVAHLFISHHTTQKANRPLRITVLSLMAERDSYVHFFHVRRTV